MKTKSKSVVQWHTWKAEREKKNIKNLWQNIFILVKTMKTCRYIVDVRLLYLVQVRVARVESINLDCKIFLWPTTLKMSLPLWIFFLCRLYLFIYNIFSAFSLFFGTLL